MASPSAISGPFIIFPLFYIICALCLGYRGTYGLFLMFLACIAILPGSKCMMFEASLPGKREKSIDARYVLALIIIVFYTVLIGLLGLDGKGLEQFGFELFLVMLLLSIDYPAMFLLNARFKGVITGALSAVLLIGLLNTSKTICPGTSGYFLIWIASGAALLAVSRAVTVKLYKRRGVTC